MDNNEFRCNCVEMARAIKDKLDAKFAGMKIGEISQYLEKRQIERSMGVSHTPNALHT